MCMWAVRNTVAWLPIPMWECSRLFVHPLPTFQVWEGRGVVATGRKIIGATNPAASEPGTIRGDYAIEVRTRACTRT